jgi:hypothetical protein
VNTESSFAVNQFDSAANAEPDFEMVFIRSTERQVAELRRQLADKAIDKENLEQQMAELQAIIAETSTELAVAKRKA